jgi:hypothetical protein
LNKNFIIFNAVFLSLFIFFIIGEVLILIISKTIFYYYKNNEKIINLPQIMFKIMEIEYWFQICHNLPNIKKTILFFYNKPSMKNNKKLLLQNFYTVLIKNKLLFYAFICNSVVSKILNNIMIGSSFVGFIYLLFYIFKKTFFFENNQRRNEWCMQLFVLFVWFQSLGFKIAG